MAIFEAKSDLDVDGKLIVKNVPNSVGTFLTLNTTTNVVSKRTNSEVISDLGLNNLPIPTASSTVLGGIKVGTNLSIDSNGVLSSTNTTYTAGTLALLQSGVNTLNRVWSAKNISDYVTGLNYITLNDIPTTYQDYTIVNNLQDDYYNGEIVKGLNEVSYLELSNLRFAVKDTMSSDLLKPSVDNLFGQIVVYDPNEIRNTEVIIKGNIKLNKQYAEDEKVYLNPYLCILCNSGSTSLQLVSSTGIRNLAVSTRNSTTNEFMVAQLGVIQYNDQTNEYYLFFNPQIL